MVSYNLDAEVFCGLLFEQDIIADMVIFDPPYSPRQISECYKECSIPVGTKETQNSLLYKRVRDSIDKIVTHGSIVLSFGWNSAGMGKKRGYEMIEILLVAHGGAHNDTICVAEKKVTQQVELFPALNK